MVTLDDVRALALALPQVSERTSFGTPAWFAGKVLMARLREDFTTLAVKMTYAERDTQMEQFPHVFFLTPHYLEYPMVLVHLEAIALPMLEQVLRTAWRQAATRKMLPLLES